MVDGWSCACALGSASSGQGGSVRYRCRPSTWLRHSIFLILFFVHTHFLSVGIQWVDPACIQTPAAPSRTISTAGRFCLWKRTTAPAAVVCCCIRICTRQCQQHLWRIKWVEYCISSFPFPLLLLLPQPDVFLLHLNRKSSGILIIPTLTSWYTERWECCSSSPYS